jgi:hypothetical protein
MAARLSFLVRLEEPERRRVDLGVEVRVNTARGAVVVVAVAILVVAAAKILPVTVVVAHLSIAEQTK